MIPGSEPILLDLEKLFLLSDSMESSDKTKLFGKNYFSRTNSYSTGNFLLALFGGHPGCEVPHLYPGRRTDGQDGMGTNGTDGPGMVLGGAKPPHEKLVAVASNFP